MDLLQVVSPEVFANLTFHYHYPCISEQLHGKCQLVDLPSILEPYQPAQRASKASQQLQHVQSRRKLEHCVIDTPNSQMIATKMTNFGSRFTENMTTVPSGPASEQTMRSQGEVGGRSGSGSCLGNAVQTTSVAVVPFADTGNSSMEPAQHSGETQGWWAGKVLLRERILERDAENVLTPKLTMVCFLIRQTPEKNREQPSPTKASV